MAVDSPRRAQCRAAPRAGDKTQPSAGLRRLLEEEAQEAKRAQRERDARR